MRQVIQSLSRANVRYVVSSDRVTDEWRNSNQYISDRVGWYDTYGDGETQHSPMTRVLYEWFTDFCASVASWAMSAPPSDSLQVLQVLADEMRTYSISHDRVRGALVVKYREGKRQYVNRGENCKVSSAESKRHDRRWEEVCEWMDGSFHAVAGLLGLGSCSFLRYWSDLVRLGRVMQEVTGESWGGPVPELDKIGSRLGWDWAAKNQADRAFGALHNLCDAVESQAQAGRCLDCWRSNEDRRREEAEEAAARAKAAEPAAAVA
jgi:hypothetical protein